jgi:phosphatidylserine/phosphatidylglycerophosphate/cardiolipin synthase-like enzyme/uncharacterized membrane protein YdjX (TVP38/TMEM64 family)
MDTDRTPSPLLQPGRNCCCRGQAEEIAFLVDGEAYFRAVREAIAQARHSILILGWDIDSRLELLREAPSDGHPPQLGDFLNSVVHSRRELQAHVLIWDFAMIYSLEREWMPIYKLGWQTHRRLHFYMDDHHPVGASQHQKVVVIDDRVAFVGGFDLSKWRWDSSEHRAEDARRTDPEGKPYPPFHDIQMVVSGAVAAELGELVRERWQRATGETLTPPPPSDTTPWPPSAGVALRHSEIAVARTLPSYNGQPEIREIEALYLDGIAAAEHWLYLENQYLTSQVIIAALCQRLEQTAGPEIIIVLPRRTGGWLEQHTMDVLRDRQLQRLQESDRHGRLRIYYASVPGTQSQFVQIHSKVMVVDERLLTIGSANLSNRSMGLDSECNLVLEAGAADRQREAIARFRNRLLGEHLDCDGDTIAETLAQRDSLIDTIEQLAGGERSLKPMAPATPEELDNLVPDQQLLDPEQPIEAEKMVRLFIDADQQQPAGGRLLGAGILLGTLLLLAVLWRWTPLGEWLTPQRLQHFFAAIATLPASPLLIMALFVIGGLVAVPLTLLVVVTVLTYGPLEGLLYSHLGATLSALSAFVIGQHLGRHTIRRLAGQRINRLSQRLAERGLLMVILLRIIPVAPFTIVNLVAGASHIRFRDFLLGTLIGLLPGILALSAFVDGLLRTLNQPGWRTAIWLLVVLAIIGVGTYLLRKGLLHRRRSKRQADVP